MKLLDDYLSLQQQIYDYFGYKEDWCVFPIDDARKYYWRLSGRGPDEVQFAENPQEANGEKGYSNEIYMQRFLSKWVYRGAEYTMILVDTHTDGNKFLQIFDNAKELTE